MPISVKGLTHIYNAGLAGETKAIQDVSFEIPDGCIAAIIGHTGSGKSTLLQHLNGLIKATEGTIVIDGEEITGPDAVLKDVRKKVGLVFQYPEYQLFEETVEKDIAFGPKNLGLSEDETDRRVREAMELVGMDYETFAARSPFDLSGGQKRRVAIAGVLAMKPEILILDEPTAGLDPGTRKDILEMVKEIHEREGNIMLFVSHNMDDVASLADMIIVMDRGRVVSTGTPAEVFREREKLEELSLGIPHAMEIMYMLKDRGLDVDTDVLTLDECEEKLAGLLCPQ